MAPSLQDRLSVVIPKVLGAVIAAIKIRQGGDDDREEGANFSGIADTQVLLQSLRATLGVGPITPGDGDATAALSAYFVANPDPGLGETQMTHPAETENAALISTTCHLTYAVLKLSEMKDSPVVSKIIALLHDFPMYEVTSQGGGTASRRNGNFFDTLPAVWRTESTGIKPNVSTGLIDFCFETIAVISAATNTISQGDAARESDPDSESGKLWGVLASLVPEEEGKHNSVGETLQLLVEQSNTVIENAKRARTALQEAVESMQGTVERMLEDDQSRHWCV